MHRHTVSPEQIDEAMNLIILPFLIGLVTYIAIALLSWIARAVSLMDEPGDRKHHEEAVPVVGGLAIYLVLSGALMTIDLPDELFWLSLSAGILVVVGALDDAFGLNVPVRFSAQIIATFVMFAGSSVWIRSLGFDLLYLEPHTWMGIFITVIAVVGLTNGFNMIDGIDGLASGLALVTLASVWLTIEFTGQILREVDWMLVLMSSVFMFWVVNLSLTKLERVFLGDSGSLLLGFLMSFVLVYYTQEPIALLHPVVALWCVTIPVFDTLVVIARRMKNKRSPFSSDRSHFHHLLLDMGIKPRTTLWMILGLSVVLNAFGIWITYVISPFAALIAFAILLTGFGYGTLHPSNVRLIALKLRLIK